MHLLNKQQEESGALKSPKRQQLSPSSSTPLFSSLVKLSDDRIDKTDDLSPNDVSPELSKLQVLISTEVCCLHGRAAAVTFTVCARSFSCVWAFV